MFNAGNRKIEGNAGRLDQIGKNELLSFNNYMTKYTADSKIENLELKLGIFDKISANNRIITKTIDKMLLNIQTNYWLIYH